MRTDWRQSKPFRYGWLPIRIIAGIVGYTLGAGVWLAAYLQWFDADYAASATEGIFGKH